MPLSFTFTKSVQSDASVFSISNTTVYGGANPLRNAGGEVMLAVRTDFESNESFLTVNSAPFDSKLTYDITNSEDGYYHFELLRFTNYSGSTTYVAEVKDINGVITTYASVVYYPVNQKFYKAILPSNSGSPQLPTNSLYWQEITDFTVSSIRKNTNIVVGIYDTIHDVRNSDSVKNLLYSLVKKDIAENSLKDLVPYFKKAIYLEGARIKANDTKYLEAELITRVLDNSFV